MSDAPPPLVIVEMVTPEHGETFAEEWRTTDSITEACSSTGIVAWPEDDREAQGRFLDIEDEITERVFGELRTAAAEAFVRVAGEVLARERKKG